MKKQMYLR